MKILTVGFCSVVIMLGLSAMLNVNVTNDVKQVIKETKPTVEQPIENQYITNNYNETNYYENNDSEKIEELESKIDELEKQNEESTNEQVLVGVNEYNIVYNAQPQQVKDPWKGPKSYKCNYAAGYPAICGYCGKQGQIHYDIKEWQDTEGTYHLTHVGCGQLYCDSIFVEPRIEESYKVR